MFYINVIFDILQEKEKYKLGSPSSFHYLNQSNCYGLDGVDDAEEYLATRRAMDIVGISEEEQVTLPEFFFLTPWVFFLKNYDIFVCCFNDIDLCFRKQFLGLLQQFCTLEMLNLQKERRSTLPSLRMRSLGSILIRLLSFLSMANTILVCISFALLHYDFVDILYTLPWNYCRCDVKSLEDALIKRVMVTPEEVITRTLDPVAAISSKDAFAKTIYSRLFDW